MLAPATRPKRQTTGSVSIPAPVGGVSAIASAEGKCIYAYNLIPVERGLGTRLGYQEWVTGITGATDNSVPSLLPFTGSAQNGSSDKLFALSSTGIWAASESSASPTQLVTFANQYGNAGRGTACVMSTTAGRFLLYCDEENGLYIYTETTDTWAQALSGTTQAWAATTAYTTGLRVVASGNVYECTVAGTSSSSAPSHGSGTAADGTVTWLYVSASSATAIGPSLADQILGYSADPANFVHVTVWKNRLWLTEKNTSRAWYLGVNSLYGTATSFDFGPKMRKGGPLVGLFNWSYDGGNGLDTLLVGLSNSGDVVIYQGTDPSSVSTFGLKGCWDVSGLPAGRRVATDEGGDLAIISTMGLVPLRKLVLGASISDSSLYATEDIAPIFNRLASLYRNVQGWALHIHPTENCLIVTVPANGPGQETIQWVMSFATKGWFQWRDLPIYSACVWNGELYFGTTDGKVCRHTGFVDGVLLAEASDPVTFSAIDWSLLTHFTNLGNANQKRVQMMRPTVLSGTGNPLFSATAKYAYDLLEPSAPSGDSGSGSATWDEAVWDTAVWGAEYSGSQPFKGAAGCGRDVAIAIRGSALSRTTLVETTVYYEMGGLLG